MKKSSASKVLRVTPSRWPDFERLFGEGGACGGCWCMLWRATRAEFERKKGAGNRRAMKALIEKGRVPGLLAYVDGEPAGWCSVAPRSEFSGLTRSRILAPVDDRPVWSVTCFFVARQFRGQGLSVELLRAAIDHVKRKGGKIVEGYPVSPKKQPMPAAFAWTGLSSAFRKAGFRECARRSERRPIMRHNIR